MKFEVRLILNNVVVKRYDCKSDFEKARKLYLMHSEDGHIYTQLVVDGAPYKTAAAERFFGGRDRTDLLFGASPRGRRGKGEAHEQSAL